MLGLFGTLNLSARSLQVQQQGIEVAGHNMANVNNPAYARQRVAIQTSSAITTNAGLEGTGSDVARIQQVRDALLDNQLVGENSETGSLEAQQQALQYAQADLGQQLDTGATGAEGAAAASVTGGQHGIGDGIIQLFKSFSALASQPSNVDQREILLGSAKTLAERFNQTDKRLSDLHDSLNVSVDSDVAKVNSALTDIAKLNEQIARAEVSGNSVANDLRDTRQAKLEELGKLVKFDSLPSDHGGVDISIGGVTLVDGTNVRDQLQTYDAGGGNLMIRTATTQTAVNVTAGHIHGVIEARDGAVQTLRDNLSNLASSFITEVNNLHRTGIGLKGTTGADFFTGTTAGDMAVNSALTAEGIQASDTSGRAGNGGVIQAIVNLQTTPQAALGGQTFSQNYAGVVAGLGSSLSSVNEKLTDQTVVTNMITSQRDSVSAVSLDEEMTDLVKFQKAYQASAQLVNTVNDMLQTVLDMMR